jgi:hypothetical protein
MNTMKERMSRVPVRSLLSALVLVLVLATMLALAACGSGGPTLKVQQTSPATSIDYRFAFVDEGSGEELVYDTLICNGTEYYDAIPVSMGALLITSPDDITVEGNKTTYNGGTVLTYDSTWKYSLENGTLTILGD